MHGVWCLPSPGLLALEHLLTGIALCITIIGIPLGLGNFKLIPISLAPLGREIVLQTMAAALYVWTTPRNPSARTRPWCCRSTAHPGS